MDRVTFHGWTAEFDREATQAQYRKATAAADECLCSECRNFIAARNSGLVYPEEVVELFRSLGIEFSRECELYCTGLVTSAKREYAGWFDVIGRLVGDENQSTAITPEFQLIPVAEASHPEGSFPKPSFRLEFQVYVPWTIGGTQGN